MPVGTNKNAFSRTHGNWCIDAFREGEAPAEPRGGIGAAIWSNFANRQTSGQDL